MVNNDPRVLFGKYVMQLRKNRGLSQEKLALKGEMARSFISELENGIRNPTLTNICKLADALDVKKAELFLLIDEEEL